MLDWVHHLDIAKWESQWPKKDIKVKIDTRRMEIGLLNHGVVKTRAMIDPCCEIIKQFALPE